MIDSAKFVVDFLFESKFKDKLIKEINYLSDCRKDGDVHFYIKNLLKEDKHTQNDNTALKQKEIIFNLRKIFKKKYKHSLNEYSTVDEFQLNSSFTRSEISIYIKNSDMMKGMLRINEVESPSTKNVSEPLAYKPVGILLFAKVLGGRYSNYWLKRDERMVYHLKQKFK